MLSSALLVIIGISLHAIYIKIRTKHTSILLIKGAEYAALGAVFSSFMFVRQMETYLEQTWLNLHKLRRQLVEEYGEEAVDEHISKSFIDDKPLQSFRADNWKKETIQNIHDILKPFHEMIVWKNEKEAEQYYVFYTKAMKKMEIGDGGNVQSK